MLFQGIIEGKQDCNLPPLILEVNAQNKHEAYCNHFFADNNEFKDFISVTKELKSFKASGDQSIIYGLEVRVSLPELKKKMISDGILKN